MLISVINSIYISKFADIKMSHSLKSFMRFSYYNLMFPNNIFYSLKAIVNCVALKFSAILLSK